MEAVFSAAATAKTIVRIDVDLVTPTNATLTDVSINGITVDLSSADTANLSASSDIF